MTVELIEDFRRFAEIEPEWSSFVQTVSGLTPFQSPQWLLTWWRHFGSGQLHVLVFRHAGEMVGILPCFLHEWDGRRQLTLIGSGISDYLEPAIAEQHCSAVIDQLRARLQTIPNWDICNWQDLCFATPLKPIASTVADDTPCYLVRMRGGFEEYWQARPKNLQRNLRRDRQKAELRGSLEFEVYTKTNLEAIQALIHLHNARWHKQGKPGMIEANRIAGFLHDVACKFAGVHMLRIFSLRFEGKIAAVILAFEYANIGFGYLTAFDPQYEALGLGRILLYESLRYSFEHGYAAWDFLRGDEPYKRWWGGQCIPKCRVIVTRRA